MTDVFSPAIQYYRKPVAIALYPAVIACKVIMSELVELTKDHEIDQSVSHTSKYAGGGIFTLSQKIISLIAIGLVVYSIFVLQTQEQLIENTLLDQSKRQALVFLHGLEREIAAFSDPLRPSVLQDLVERSSHDMGEMEFSVFRLYIYDRDGNVLADSSEKIEVKKNIREYVHNIFRKDKSYLGDEIEWKMDESRGRKIPVVEVLIPLHLAGKVAGIVEVEVDLERTKETIKRIDDAFEFRTIVISVVAGLIMMVFLWIVVHRSLLGPVLEIGEVSKRIAEGDLSGRLNVRGHGELAQLARAVNTMADGIQRLIEEQEAAYLQVMQSLAKALEAKDPYTAGHSARVARWSVRLARHMGLSEEETEILKQGALMHDLGKIAIPDAILNKPEKLTDEEFAAMRNHPEMTANIMRPLHRFDRHREIAAWHHERWDGCGYPDGLRGKEIPLLARIVSIADTWDAMTGDRVYRKGMPDERALKILVEERESGQWDPEVLDAFVQMVESGNIGVTDDSYNGGMANDAS